MNVEIKVEWSKSGKTFGVAFAKVGEEKPFAVVKMCKIGTKADGSEFVSGPSSKQENGEWLNYTYFAQGFSDHILALAKKSTPKALAKTAELEDDLPF